ncbi:MAG TPA: SHOCT domain-containing protein [archaeon]
MQILPRNCGTSRNVLHKLRGSYREPSHGAHSPSALQTENVLDEIAKLEALRDRGVITEIAFREQRKNLIATLTVKQSKKS